VARVVAPAKKIEPETPAQRRVVDIVPTPKAVRVTLDGKSLGDFGPQLARMELEPGAHTFTFESPFCYTQSVPVRADESPGRILAHLKWKPANLTVHVQPANADIIVDGRLPLKSGQTVPQPIEDNVLDGRREVTIRASASGFESQELHVKLRAADEKKVEIELKPRAE
jgi:hypothetical protein